MEWKVDDWHAGEGKEALQDRLNALAEQGWTLFELVRAAEGLMIVAWRQPEDDSEADEAVAIKLSTRERLIAAARQVA